MEEEWSVEEEGFVKEEVSVEEEGSCSSSSPRVSPEPPRRLLKPPRGSPAPPRGTPGYPRCSPGFLFTRKKPGITLRIITFSREVFIGEASQIDTSRLKAPFSEQSLGRGSKIRPWNLHREKDMKSSRTLE